MPKHKHPLGYPYNLVEDVLQEECQNIMDQDRIDGIEAAVDVLNDREKHILELRYKNGMTLREVGEILGVTRQRVREIQVRILKKLRNQSRIRLVKYGLSFVEAENEVEHTDILDAPIYELDLSTRVHNCLARANIKTLGDLINFCDEYRAYDPYGLFGLIGIRNIGRKSYAEIIQKLKYVWGFSLEAYFKKLDEENNK